MRHFLNAEMLAVNAKTIPRDTQIVAECADPAKLPGRLISVVAGSTKWNSDIEWVSGDDEEAFRGFESAFERLGFPSRRHSISMSSAKSGYSLASSSFAATALHPIFIPTGRSSTTRRSPC